MLALGYTIGRYLHKTKMAAQELVVEDMEVDKTPSQDALQATITKATHLLGREKLLLHVCGTNMGLIEV